MSPAMEYAKAGRPSSLIHAKEEGVGITFCGRKVSGIYRVEFPVRAMNIGCPACRAHVELRERAAARTQEVA